MSTITALEAQLQQDNTSKPIIYQHLDIKPLLNEKILFFIIALLLLVEWFLRRFWGAIEVRIQLLRSFRNGNIHTTLLGSLNG
ncbi:MAG: hypothetical protein IPH96_15820 [Saprospiraceae bacterium]|nr:hypothetical protein [Saprospiraceae bacterium]